MIQLRENCVICQNQKKLIPFASILYPVHDCYISNNSTWDMVYAYCEECYSVQLKTLLDPEILYSGSYFQPVHNKYWWVQHNIAFVNFIISNIHR